MDLARYRDAARPQSAGSNVSVRPAEGLPDRGPEPRMTLDLSDLPAVEQALWPAATSFDRVAMANTTSEDFIEFGRSGAFFTRDDILSAPNAAQDVEAVLHDIALRPLSAGLALVTYLSEECYPAGMEWSNRSSIRDRSSGSGQVRFNQGTPCEDRP